MDRPRSWVDTQLGRACEMLHCMVNSFDVVSGPHKYPRFIVRIVFVALHSGLLLLVPCQIATLTTAVQRMNSNTED